jgi:hypothetical protein
MVLSLITFGCGSEPRNRLAKTAPQFAPPHAAVLLEHGDCARFPQHRA